MKRLHILVSVALSISSCSQSQLPIGIATELTISSRVLNEERVIAVSLPEGYEQNDARYPVLYLLDGMQNLRHVVGSSEVLTRTGNLPPLIIVGIKSGERMRDFTPSKVQEVEMSGGGAKFLNFMQNELVPYIEARHRTHPYRILEGHSMGGLFAAYAFMESPQLFDAYILMSPALWWNKEELTSRVGSFLEANATLDKSLYFGIGTEDGNGMRQELKAFANAIEEGAPEGLRWESRARDICQPPC